MIDPQANASFHKAKSHPFRVGDRVWVNGMPFFVAQIANNQVLLRAVDFELSGQAPEEEQ